MVKSNKPANLVKPKILLIDIEISPSLGYTWGKWEQDVIQFVEEWYILCFATKWLRKKTFVKALPDYRHYKKGNDCEYNLIYDLWKLLDEADIVIAHNGDAFDLRKINSRFAFYNLPPPSPYKTVDTLKIARKYYGFNSNKLNDLSVSLGLGKKIETGGFALWKACMDGNRKAWKKMIRYNFQDVNLLERIYLKFLPWMQSHPNLGTYLNKEVCGKCGSNKLQSRGYEILKTTKYRRFHCQNCGGWGRFKDRVN